MSIRHFIDRFFEPGRPLLLKPFEDELERHREPAEGTVDVFVARFGVLENIGLANGTRDGDHDPAVELSVRWYGSIICGHFDLAGGLVLSLVIVHEVIVPFGGAEGGPKANPCRSAGRHREEVRLGRCIRIAAHGLESEEIDRLVRKIRIEPGRVREPSAAVGVGVGEEDFHAPLGMVLELEKEIPEVPGDPDRNAVITARHVWSLCVVQNGAGNPGVCKFRERGPELDIGDRFRGRPQSQ